MPSISDSAMAYPETSLAHGPSNRHRTPAADYVGAPKIYY
jgi:hypothetical protein